MKRVLLLFFALSVLAAPTYAHEGQAHVTTVTFPSSGGVTATADLYLAHADPATPFIVLFHRAGWSRGEYREIAPELNRLGFNCMAVDQRSGKEVNGVPNETAKSVGRLGRKTTYVDALPDVVAALRYARDRHAKGKLIAWGSSYSAALVIKVAGDSPELADGVVSFSPGEYFAKLGKPDTWIEASAKKVGVPVFVTSGKGERHLWENMFGAIPPGAKVSFIPRSEGRHGSSALWRQFPDSGDYWSAVTGFLQAHFETR